MARVNPQTDPVILGTGEGTDSPEEWKKWVEEGSEENRERELIDQGVEEEYINPPEDEEPPAESGGSAFTGEEIDVAFLGAVGRRLGRPFRTLSAIGSSGGKDLPAAFKIKQKGKPLVTIGEEAKPARPELDPEKLSPERAKELTDEYDAMLRDSQLKEYDYGESIHMNYENYAGPKDFEKAQAEIAEYYRIKIETARRGPAVHDEVTEAMARDMSDDPEFLAWFLRRGPGQTHASHEILAAHKILETSAYRLKELAIYLRRHASGDQVLPAQLAFLEQWNFHKNWLAQYMGARAEAGRSLRAFRGDQLLGADVSVRRSRMQEMIEQFGSGMDVDRMADQALANDSLLGLNKTVKSQSTGISKWGAAMTENMTGSILYGLSTAAVNIFGNAMMSLRHPANLVLASRLGRWTMKGQNEIEVGEAMANLFGMMMAVKDGMHAGWISLKTTEPYGGSAKFEGARTKAISSQALGIQGGPWGFIVDVWGNIARAPMERLLGPTDAFYKVINERGMWAQLAYRQAVKDQRAEELSGQEFSARLVHILQNPTEDVKTRMVEHGEYQTFTNPLGDLGRKLQKVINHASVGRLLVPVFRTPAQITKVGFLEDSPLGFAFEGQRRLMFPKPEPGTNRLSARQVEDAEMARARMMTGIGIISWFAMSAWNGDLTGSGPKDRHARNALRSGQWRPRSVVLERDEQGNPTKWRSFDRMEPWSLTIGLVADFADVMRVAQHMDLDQTQLDLIEQMGAALTVAVSENTLNKTYMRGVNEAMNAVQEPDRNWSRWAASMVNAQIPLSGLRRDIRKMQDPLVREAQTIMERLKSAMPYFSDDLPALQDLHGNYVEYEHILNLPLKTFFTEGDEATNEYLRLYETTQNVPVTKPGRRLYGIKLNASEYHDLQQIGRKGIKLNPLTDKFLLPNYNPDAEFDNRVRPISAEGFMDFQEVIEYLMSSAQYNDPEVTDYARVVMIKKLQERYDQSARRFLAAHDVEKEGSVAYKVMLKKQNKVRRIHGREKADQMLREQGIEVLEPTGGKSPFKSISNLFSN